MKTKKDISNIRSSASEYLTFVAGSGNSDMNAVYTLEETSVIRNFRITAADGKNYDTMHYNLSAIIAKAHAGTLRN